MFSDKMTKNIYLVLIVVIVASVCGTIILKTRQGATSRASDVEGSGASIDELVDYGIDLSKEEEYEIDKTVDLSEYEYGLSKNIEDGTILFAWCWSFDTIKENLPSIAAAGYTSVQTSPVSACYVAEDGGMEINGDGKWYYQQQVTDYTIGNYQIGTRDELKSLCKEADKYGIKIIAEIIANQLCYKQKEISQDLIDIAGDSTELFHIFGETGVSASDDRLQRVTFNTGDGIDVNTENPSVQNYLLDFLYDCLDVGVDGFRFADADSIALPDDPLEEGSSYTNDFWTNILAGIKKENKEAFIYGDIESSSVNRINDYANTIGKVTAKDNSDTMRAWINNENLEVAHMTDYGNTELNISNLVTFVEDYTSYIEKNYDVFSEAQIKIGWAVIASRAGGTPIFFSRPEGGGVKNSWWGSVNKIGEAGSDLYKDTDVVAVNRFRNAMAGEDENLFNPNDSKNVLIIERGDKGCVIINAGYEYKIDVETKLDEGLYYNMGSSETILESKDGRLSGVIPQETIIVIYRDDADNVNIPVVSVSGYGMDSDFYTEELTVTLQAVNAEEAIFSLGGKSYKYEKGKTLTFGKNMAYNDTINITLKAISEDGVVTEKTFPFTKKERDKNEKVIFFEKPDDWNQTVYVYFYANGGFTFKEGWPGVLMDDVGGGIYTYSVTEKWDDIKVVFTDGVKQYPDVMLEGEDLEAGKTYKAITKIE